MIDDAKAGSLDVPVRLSATSVQCLRRSVELIERITPGNCSHHAGNIRVMLKAVLEEVESSNAPILYRAQRVRAFGGSTSEMLKAAQSPNHGSTTPVAD